MNLLLLLLLAPVIPVDPVPTDTRRMSSASSQDIAETHTVIEPRIVVVHNVRVPEVRAYRHPNFQPEPLDLKTCVTICILVGALAVLIWFISRLQ